MWSSKDVAKVWMSCRAASVFFSFKSNLCIFSFKSNLGIFQLMFKRGYLLMRIFWCIDGKSHFLPLLNIRPQKSYSRRRHRHLIVVFFFFFLCRRRRHVNIKPSLPNRVFSTQSSRVLSLHAHISVRINTLACLREMMIARPRIVVHIQSHSPVHGSDY